jgi:hypothetical protein
MDEVTSKGLPEIAESCTYFREFDDLKPITKGFPTIQRLESDSLTGLSKDETSCNPPLLKKRVIRL